jgi:ribosomal protein L3 glutamine methyltransferase
MQPKPAKNLADIHAGMPAGAAVSCIANAFDAAGLWYGHGTGCAADEASWLVGSVLGVDYGAEPEVLLRTLDRLSAHALSDAEARRIRDLGTARIARRVPLAYLLGEAWFAGLRFAVDERVLVPRSPIAELIAEGYAPWAEPDRVRRVLEIGTGSGCIAIATALALPGAHVDATDISAPALAVARENVARHGVGDRVTLIGSDLFRSLPRTRYDLIVTNPPYVDAAEMRSREAEYRHEPEIGLAAGADGLSIVRRLLAEAADWLEPEGALIVEVGVSNEALQRAYPTVPFLWLAFEHGGQGVFVLTRADLEAHEIELRGDPNTAVT